MPSSTVQVLGWSFGATLLLGGVLAYLRWGLPRLAAVTGLFVTGIAVLALLLAASVAPRVPAACCAGLAAALLTGHLGWLFGAMAMRSRWPGAALSVPNTGATRSAPATLSGQTQPPSGHPTSAPAPLERQSLGRYRIEREIGRGAMGAVYLGTDPKIGRQVAIKTMALGNEFQGEALAEARRRFFREAETAGRLQHPDIVTIYDAGEELDLAYIAMEHLKGADLLRHARPGALLPVPVVVQIAARVADALAYAHSHGVVHRDIKPANVMVDLASDVVKVTDFGIARIADANRTRTGMVLGTPSFMSPEQMAGKRVDGRSDLYSLGVMLYQLLTGHLPHRADTMAMLMYEIANQTPPDVRNWRPEVPESLAKVVATSLAKRPEDRHADGRAMAAELLATVGDVTDPPEQFDPSAPASTPPDSSGFHTTVKLNRGE